MAQLGMKRCAPRYRKMQLRASSHLSRVVAWDPWGHLRVSVVEVSFRRPGAEATGDAGGT